MLSKPMAGIHPGYVRMKREILCLSLLGMLTACEAFGLSLPGSGILRASRSDFVSLECDRQACGAMPASALALSRQGRQAPLGLRMAGPGGKKPYQSAGEGSTGGKKPRSRKARAERRKAGGFVLQPGAGPVTCPSLGAHTPWQDGKFPCIKVAAVSWAGLVGVFARF